VLFTRSEVDAVGELLQRHMRDNDIRSMTADECAQVVVHLLPPRPPKFGFVFRQMLRDGRDGRIVGAGGRPYLVRGASQPGGPNTRWHIDRVDD